MSDSRIHRRLIDTLYVDAMVLADEARGYFDQRGRHDRDSLDPMSRVCFSCESLKVTTRLMHVIAWLLTQRAVDCGEMAPREALDPSRRLGPAPVSDMDAVEAMPPALAEREPQQQRQAGQDDDRGEDLFEHGSLCPRGTEGSSSW
jgi:regulator of CtrA degradation